MIRFRAWGYELGPNESLIEAARRLQSDIPPGVVTRPMVGGSVLRLLNGFAVGVLDLTTLRPYVAVMEL